MTVKKNQIERKADVLPESSTPETASGEGSFFVKSSDGKSEGFYVDGDGNETQLTRSGGVVASSSTTTELVYLNNTGITLDELRPVCTDDNGNMKTVDISSEDDALSIMGVNKVSTPHGGNSIIVSNGLIKDVVLTGDLNDPIFISPTGELTNVKPNIGVGGFLAGHFIVRVGRLQKNQTDPLKKDLLVNIIVVGQL